MLFQAFISLEKLNHHRSRIHAKQMQNQLKLSLSHPVKDEPWSPGPSTEDEEVEPAVGSSFAGTSGVKNLNVRGPHPTGKGEWFLYVDVIFSYDEIKIETNKPIHCDLGDAKLK